jgi:hypothetical protein
VHPAEAAAERCRARASGSSVLVGVCAGRSTWRCQSPTATHRPHAGRVRNRQGADRQPDPVQLAPRLAAVHQDQLRSDSAKACSRPSSSATSAAPSPTPARDGSVALRRRAAEHSFLTRSAR